MCCRADVPEPEVRLHVNFVEEITLEKTLKIRRVKFCRALWQYWPSPQKLSRRSVPDLLAMTVPQHKVHAFLQAVTLDILLP